MMVPGEQPLPISEQKAASRAARLSARSAEPPQPPSDAPPFPGIAACRSPGACAPPAPPRWSSAS